VIAIAEQQSWRGSQQLDRAWPWRRFGREGGGVSYGDLAVKQVWVLHALNAGQAEAVEPSEAVEPANTAPFGLVRGLWRKGRNSRPEHGLGVLDGTSMVAGTLGAIFLWGTFGRCLCLGAYLPGGLAGEGQEHGLAAFLGILADASKRMKFLSEFVLLRSSSLSAMIDGAPACTRSGPCGMCGMCCLLSATRSSHTSAVVSSRHSER
jgi:hypothetical protein